MKPVRTLALVVLTLTLAGSVSAQAPGVDLGAQNLRPYWHVFAAYAIAWLVIGGWVFSIARRLGTLERRIGE